jgi:chromosome partitioning protein
VETVISFVNTKGGVGKSTLAVHLAVWLADRGCRVALLDADDQATAAKWVAEITDHAVRIEKLAAADDNARVEEVRTKINSLAKSYDFVIVDTKGSAALPTSVRAITIIKGVLSTIIKGGTIAC